MERIFEIASSISTPLGLGGLFAAIVFFVFQQILAKNFFHQLTSANTLHVITLIIERLFFLSLVAMILGFVTYLVTKSIPQPKPTHPPVAAVTPATTVRPIRIGSAIYGISDQSKRCDATARVRDICDGLLRCPIIPTNSFCGDPQKHTPKLLFVIYSCGQAGQPTLRLKEGFESVIDCSQTYSKI